MPKSRAAVGDQRVDLDERAGVEQQLDPFAGGELPRLVLFPDPILAAADLRRRQALLELIDPFARACAMTADLVRIEPPHLE